MKELIQILGLILILIGVMASPVSVFYGAYEWVASDVEFKYALWSGLKLWGLMLLAFIPGFILYFWSEN